MRFILWIFVSVLVVHATVVQAQLLSRLLNHFMFKSRHSDEDDGPRYPRRRPPPRRRYHRRPSDPSDPFKYDPDDEDYHKEHALPRPPRRPTPSHRRTHPSYSQGQPNHPSAEQDGDDNNPPMTIYLQPGANGDLNKPRRIRVVTLDSYPPYHRELGYGHNNPYQSGLWNKGYIQRDMIFPQNNRVNSPASKRGSLYPTYGGPTEPVVGHIVHGFGASNSIDPYSSSSNRGGGPGTGGTIMVPDPSYHHMNAGYASASGHQSGSAGGDSFDMHAESTTPAKFDYDYYRRKRKK